MLDETLSGGFQNPPVQSADAFRAALNVMARPGRIETLGGASAPAPVSAAAATLLQTLCDRETPLYLAPGHDTPAVREWIAFHIGAPICNPETAQFALGRWQAFGPLAAFPIGTPDYPDRSTTLIVEMDILSATGPRLSGPGIKTEARLLLPTTDAFQTNRALFPLGHDFFFTAGSHLAALPRSTHVRDI